MFLEVKRRNLISFIFCLFLSGCAEQQKKSAVLVPVEERNAPVKESNEQSVNNNVEVIENKTTVKETQPVIVALLNDADKLAEKGNSQAAYAAIERAIRIEPKNALLWQRLAKIRLQQQQWQQVIALARKSNALAGSNSTIKSENWGLIAIAYEKLGNGEKAEEARKKQTNQV